jgi:transcriptional regulator with XRE-family HTH domain
LLAANGAVHVSATARCERLSRAFPRECGRSAIYEKGVSRVGAARLQQIATALDVPMTFFYDDDGLGKRASDGKREVESLLFLDSSFSLRLLRAYNAVPQHVQRQLVSLFESIAEAKAT